MNSNNSLFKPSMVLAAALAFSIGSSSAAPGLPPPAATRTDKKQVQGKAVPQKGAREHPKDLLVPFRAGEALAYRIAWSAFSTAASLELSVPERRDLFGWSTWHFRASLHTQSPVRSLFTIDDEFDSYADTITMETRQYESYLNELGKKMTEVLHFVPVGQTTHAPPPNVIVLSGTRDPVAILFALRAVDWQRTAEFRAPLYDGHNVYQLTARLDNKNETVKVAAGTFSASKLAVRLSPNNKAAGDINFEVWLANDAARTPVQFQAQLPFGNIHAELLPVTR